MNKPFYKSTGVMGSLAVIVSALVALVASLASLRGLEITPENQALIVSLVMTLAGGVAALIGRLKASDVMFSDVLVSEMSSERGCSFSRSLTGIKQGPHPEFGGSLPGVEPDTPWERPAPFVDDACPKCGTKFGAHVLGCPEASAASQADVVARLLWQAQEKPVPPPVDAYQVIGVAKKLRSDVPLTAEDLEAIRLFLTAIGSPAPFVRGQAGFPAKDSAEPMAEGQLLGNPGAVPTA